MHTCTAKCLLGEAGANSTTIQCLHYKSIRVLLECAYFFFFASNGSPI